MKIKTRGINRIDPVQNFTVIGYKRLNDVDVEISVEWNNSKSKSCLYAYYLIVIKVKKKLTTFLFQV